ncbi:MAG: hypothetical protein PHE67_00555 [Campylobacterales bacterium]|nr:hypothetical protein [Campylobacterales bacterium]
MKDTIDKKIDTCFRSIRNLLYFVFVMCSGIGGTFGLADKIISALGDFVFKFMLIIEFLAVAIAILHIFLKFVRIELLNIKERSDG